MFTYPISNFTASGSSLPAGFEAPSVTQPYPPSDGRSRYLVDRACFPKIPEEALNYFREVEESIFSHFFQMFALGIDEDAAFAEMDHTLSDLAPVSNPNAEFDNAAYEKHLSNIVYS